MNKVFNFLSGKWLMTDDHYERLLSAVIPTILKGNIESAEQILDRNVVTCYATSPYLADRWELDDDDLPYQSVAVINLEGPLFSWETFRLEKLLNQSLTNDKIVGVVLWINGPGGMTDYLDVVCNLITSYTKPIVTYVAGTMASAHFWIGTATQRSFIASKLCEVGSCGTMATYVNFSEYYKQNGIDVRDIYPDSADLKNKWFRDIADKNDETRVKQMLEETHKEFCDSVSKNLGISYDPKDPLFRGEIFSGQEAVDKGYVDQFGNLQDAVAWVLAKSTVTQANQVFTE